MIKALWTVAPPTFACRKRCSRPRSRPSKQLPRWVLPLSRLLHNCEISWPEPAVWILVWHWFSGMILQNIWVASSLYTYHNVSLGCVRCQFEAEMQEKCVSLGGFFLQFSFVFVFFIFKFSSVIVLSQRFHKLYAPTVFFSFGQFPHHLPPSNSALCLPPLNLVSVPTSAFFYIHILAVEPDVGFSFVNLQNIWTCSYTIQNQESVGLLAHCFDLMWWSIHWPLTLNPTWVRTFVCSLRISIFRHSLLASFDCCPNWTVTILAS